jgi:hypothetical protein
MLETMIYEIRLNGFDRIKAEIEEKQNIKKTLENSVASLENTIKFTRNSKKTNYTEFKNLIRETDTMMFIGDVKTSFLIDFNHLESSERSVLHQQRNS